ncbi:hypothetical protein D3C81_1056810 [compost metagenome]
MVRQHGPVGRNCIACRAGHIAAHGGVPDVRLIPTHAVRQHKLIAVSYRHEHLGKWGVHTFGHYRAGLGEQRIQVRRLERHDAVLDDQFMLAMEPGVRLLQRGANRFVGGLMLHGDDFQCQVGMHAETVFLLRLTPAERAVDYRAQNAADSFWTQ